MRCFFRHDWRPWSAPVPEIVCSAEGVVYRRRIQQRTCCRCEIAQIREVDRVRVLVEERP